MATSLLPSERLDGVDLPVRRVPHPVRWVATTVVAFLVLMFVNSLVSNDQMRWETVGEYLFDRSVLNGLWVTVKLTAVAGFFGIIGGTVLALMRMSPSVTLRWISAAYLWIIRGTPILVQLLFFYFLASLYPTLGLGIPFGPTFVSADTNELISRMVAAYVAFSVNEAAYMAENVRAGILSVPAGQREAAAALGVSYPRALRHIVLPQAMRVMVPTLVNRLITLLKETSVVMLIALPDLLTSVQLIYSENFLQIPLLIVASIWYLAIVTILTVAQRFIERHYGKGVARASSRTRRGHSGSASVTQHAATGSLTCKPDDGERP